MKTTDIKATVNSAASTLFEASSEAYDVAKIGMVFWGLTSLAAAVVQLATTDRSKDETTEK